MDGEPGPDRPPAGREVAVAGRAVPTMPRPTPGTLWSSAYSIPTAARHRYLLGWQRPKNDDPCFVLLRNGPMGGKVIDRFPMTEEGWARAWAALVDLDTDAAQGTAQTIQEWSVAAAARKAEVDRRFQVYEAFANAGGATVFKLLGVQVLVSGGMVYTIGLHDATAQANTSQLLGPLAGAQAMVTDGAQAWSPGRALFLPIALTGLATKAKADAAVVFPDGTAHTIPLDGNYAVREAQKQVVQFNALAGAATPVAAETGGDPAARLRQLEELRDAGLLTQDEYEAKRTEIINSI